MSETLQASYMDHIREITAKVSMNFYNNSAEDNGEIFVNRTGWGYDANALQVTAPGADWFFPKRNQISTYGMITKGYACLDGYSMPDSCYIADTSPDGIMGLWSDKNSSSIDGTYPNGGEPIFTIYYNQPRKLNQVIVTGNAVLKQFPVNYEIRLYDELPIAPRMMFMSSQAPRVPIIGTDKEGKNIIGQRDDTNKCYVFSITGGKSYEQTLTFFTKTNSSNNEANILTFKRMELKVKKWSHPGAVAKIMYFSIEINMNFTGDEIRSIEVFEEKMSDSSNLSYGLSSNTCTIYAKDDGRLSGNLALLKKNKTILPSLALRNENTPPKDTDYISLGRFYSDSWEMDSRSTFVKCKAYDDIYALQNIMLEFPLSQDGASYKVRTEVPVKQLLTEVIEMINTEKHNQEIYGMDIHLDNESIDNLLSDIKIPYLLFERKSAWDVLQDIANFALCNIYVNRAGKICARVDAPPKDKTSSPPQVALIGESITPDNSFTYALPIQTKTVVNRVLMPYYIIGIGDTKDDTIEIKPEHMQTVDYTEGGVAKTKMVFTAKLTNFYKEITGIELFNIINGDRQEKINENVLSKKVFFDNIVFEIKQIIDFEKLIVKIVRTVVSDCNLLQEDKLVHEDKNKLSIKVNGVCEYTHGSNQLMVGKDTAKNAADRIIYKYNDGVNYLETDWTGSPNLQPSNLINSKNKIGDVSQTYECLSNEFNFNGGLRAKTKLRK